MPFKFLSLSLCPCRNSLSQTSLGLPRTLVCLPVNTLLDCLHIEDSFISHQEWLISWALPPFCQGLKTTAYYTQRTVLSAIHLISNLILTAFDVVLLLSPILKSRKWRLREDRELSQSHTTRKRRSKDSNLDPSYHEPLFLTTAAMRW